MRARVYDDRPCELGEGPFWHPERAQLYWFDILQGRLLTRGRDGPQAWEMGEAVSAGGWIDHDRLLIAGPKGLFVWHLETGAREMLVEIEPDRAETRSNDGKADPWGGFWLGTMGREEGEGRGAFYRWHDGELRHLMGPLTITNSLAFAPDRSVAYLSDTPQRKVWRWALHPDTGWPVDEPELHLDLGDAGLNPDGATCDAEGTLWVACWGASRVVGFRPDGSQVGQIDCAASQTSCPAFGGADLKTLYITSARKGTPSDSPADESGAGMTFVARMGVAGTQLHQVRL